MRFHLSSTVLKNRLTQMAKGIMENPEKYVNPMMRPDLIIAWRLITCIAKNEDSPDSSQDAHQRMPRLRKVLVNNETRYEVIPRMQDGSDGEVIGYVDEKNIKLAYSMWISGQHFKQKQKEIEVEFFCDELFTTESINDTYMKPNFPAEDDTVAHKDGAQSNGYEHLDSFSMGHVDIGMLENLNIRIEKLEKKLLYHDFLPHNGNATIVITIGDKCPDNKNNDIHKDNNMTPEEILKALSQGGAQIGQFVYQTGDHAEAKYYARGKNDDEHPFVDASEVKDEGNDTTEVKDNAQEKTQTPPPPVKSLTEGATFNTSVSTELKQKTGGSDSDNVSYSKVSDGKIEESDEAYEGEEPYTKNAKDNEGASLKQPPKDKSDNQEELPPNKKYGYFDTDEFRNGVVLAKKLIHNDKTKFWSHVYYFLIRHRFEERSKNQFGIFIHDHGGPSARTVYSSGRYDLSTELQNSAQEKFRWVANLFPNIDKELEI